MQEVPEDMARRLRETAETFGTSFDDMTMEAIVEATGYDIARTAGISLEVAESLLERLRKGD